MLHWLISGAWKVGERLNWWPKYATNLDWSRCWSHFFIWDRDPVQQSSLCDRYRARKISRKRQSWIKSDNLYVFLNNDYKNSPKFLKFAWRYLICTENYDDVARHLQIPISNNPQYAAIYVTILSTIVESNMKG